jgi:hypothetical protein
MSFRESDKNRGSMEPRPGQMVRFQERGWMVTVKDSTPWASRWAHTRFVTLVSVDGQAAEITLPEDEWHLILEMD